MDFSDLALLATKRLIILLVLLRSARCPASTIQLGFEHLNLIVSLHYHCLLFLGFLCFFLPLAFHLLEVGLKLLDFFVFTACYILVLTLCRFFLLKFGSHFL